jgi:nicotinamidase/pyrazinamidase
MKLNKEFTASFDVDAMKTFSPLCPNELPVPGGDEISDALNEQATLARLRVGSKDAHSPHSKHIATETSPQFSPVVGHPELDIHWNQHAIVGTDGFDLLPGLPAVLDYDFMVYKGVDPTQHPYGACYHNLNWRDKKRQSTGVIEYLICNDIQNVIVGGLATDYCVKNTCLQLADAGFNVFLNLKASRGIAPDTINAAIEEMEAAGVVVVDDITTM